MKSKAYRSLFALIVGVSSVLSYWTPEALAQDTIVPAPFPQDLNIPGFNFPEPAHVVNQWLINQTAPEPASAAKADASITKHMWGIWTGLTRETDRTYNGQKLLVFETWLTPQDINNK